MKYKFKAKDWNGKNVTGELDLGSKEEVLESIRSNGLVPLSVTEVSSGYLGGVSKKFLHRVGLKQITTFTRELSTMMTAGLPLTDALSMLKNQSEASPTMFEILDSCLNSVRGGQPLGKSLEKYKSIFGEAYVASVTAGEEGGVLEEVLQKLAINLENQNEFSSKVKGAMIYPAIVVVGMIIVSMVMMIFVIPKLTSLYADMGTAKLPPITRGLMAVSDFMTRWWFLMPLAFFGITALFKTGAINPELRLKLDVFKLRIPIWGELLKKTIMADSVRTMSMMLAAGISLVDSLRIVSNVANNELYRRAYIKIAERVQKGFSISSSFEETGVFPVIVNQMVSTGEATGKLDEVLLKVANYFSSEAEQSVKALTSAIEPVIMIVLGIGVAFLVVAVIMPIYNLTSQF